MRAPSNWFKVVRRKFAKKPSQRDIIVINDTASHLQPETVATEDEESADLLHAIETSSFPSSHSNRVVTKEDIAAMTIQAHFRGHLARRAFRALRSLVKLQAMVRGARVRQQARIALHCMHAMVRLQVSVRARQLLGGGGGGGDRSTLHGRLC